MTPTMKWARTGMGFLLASTVGLAAARASVIQHVFVITMENTDASRIYGNTTDAPYINNTLLPAYAHSSNWNDELPSLASEPHYIWMEAGTNAFADHTFTTDNDPSRKNSTSSTAHLVTQIKNSLGVTWMTYQEGQNATTGSCPTVSSGFYAAKHNPFVFFQDVAGNPPSKTNAYCAAHSKPYRSFAADLTGPTCTPAPTTPAVSYDHRSLIKSVEEIFGLPLLSTVSGATDLADLFQAGFFP